jgi:hypothetical protein
LALDSKDGLLLASDFAGMRTADQAVNAGFDLLVRTGAFEMPPTVTTLYTCDCGSAPSLVCLDGLNPAQHHIHDMNDRIPVDQAVNYKQRVCQLLDCCLGNLAVFYLKNLSPSLEVQRGPRLQQKCDQTIKRAACSCVAAQPHSRSSVEVSVVWPSYKGTQ